MKFKKSILFIIFMFLTTNSAKAIDYTGSVMLGYNNGTSIQLTGSALKFTQNFPLSFQLGIAYNSINPGKSDAARKIFINDATNGEPQKSGWVWEARMNFLYKVHWLSLQKAYVYAGPRFSMYTGNFKYIGGNEDFDITSDQWGLGTGIISFFPISNRLDFSVESGFDYFFPAELYGHDTVYSPDGENINARNDYTYKDADSAINQPKLNFRIMIGFNYHF